MCSGAKIKTAPRPSSTKKMGLVPKSSSSKIANNNHHRQQQHRPKRIPTVVVISNSNSNNSADSGTTAAFNGAKVDKSGYCLKHPSIQLVNPMEDNNGKVIYQEIKVTCPSCQAFKYKAKKSTSLGGGKVRTGHRIHGTPPPPSSSSSRRSSRSKSRERSSERSTRSKSTSRSSQSGRSVSKSRECSSSTNKNLSSSSSSKPQRHYETPFDSKGWLQLQLAAKQFTGGWKMLHSAYPKCMEDKMCVDIVSDDRSVKSSSSRRSLHRADAMSVSSKKSTRSTSSRKSSRSVRSSTSRGAATGGGSGSKQGKASKSGRYGSLPFDRDGYCCRHPNIQLAKKKALGGYKIIHDVCPECAHDDEDNRSIRSRGSSRSRRSKSASRRNSGTGRVFDDTGLVTSSVKSSGSKGGGGIKKKRI